MKKILVIMSCSVLFITACSGGKNASAQLDPEKAAKKLAELQAKVKHIKNPDAPLKTPLVAIQSGALPAKITDVTQAVDVKKVEVVEKPNVEETNFVKLSVSPANGSKITKEPLVLSGKVSANVTKIVVTATSESGKYNDVYQLNDFKPGFTDFTYRASTAWENLWYGMNIYEIKAYFKDGTSKSVKIKIAFAK